ncbi:hypothetical protein Adt_27595 [Abeliophyllum distichum]|uniref:Uncharacterized protein n=1 Tax=Abeliophyllum distichum TaxID=126358 RepID=A0ABD1RU62_9LAMI
MCMFNETTDGDPHAHVVHKKITRVHELDGFTALAAQMAAMTKRFEEFTSGQTVKAVQAQSVVCEKFGTNHHTSEYPITQACDPSIEHVSSAQNPLRQQNNSYSSTNWLEEPS